jgi:hypothetical protein
MKNTKIFSKIKTLFTHRWRVKVIDDSGRHIATLRYTTKEYDDILLAAKFESLTLQEYVIKSIRDKK